MIGRRRAVVALATAALSASVALAAPQEIRWGTGIERAAALSRESGKPILVEFWATWCPACKAMDEQVYSDPAVAAAMSKVLPVRVDIDRDPSMTRRYRVTGTPTLVLIDAAGGELFRFTGQLERGPILELLRELPGDIRRINRLSAALAANKNDLVALGSMGDELRQTGLYVASNRYYEEALQTQDARRDATTRVKMLTAIASNYTSLKRADQAADWLRRALREGRGLPAEAALMLELARAQVAANQLKDARRTLDDLARQFPGSSAAAEGARLAATLHGG